MADTRDKLIELLIDCPDIVRAWCGEYQEAADYLLANGVIPVKHGRWIERTHDDGDGVGYILYHCSLCDTPDARKRNYCRECGAKMDGGEENV